MAEDDVMIAQADRRGQRINIKVRRRMNKGYSPNSYQKVLNHRDYNDLALLFEDLSLIFGAPIEKAYLKFKERKSGGGYPFV